MALLTSELWRLKIELGYNGLTLSALPYAFDGITAIFDQVVVPYLESGTLTTSTTVVTAQAAPTNATLTLASVVGISLGDRLIVDVDTSQEAAHVSAIVGSAVTLALQFAHGTAGAQYQVNQEGAESIVRYRLNQCISIADRIARSANRAGVKKADEVEFFSSGNGQKGVVDDLLRLQAYWRTELATACGCGPNLNPAYGGGGYTCLEN